MILDWSLLLNLLRIRSGKPLTDFAWKSGMSHAALWRLAAGDAVEPTWSQGCALLDVCADWLTDEDWGRVRESMPLMWPRATRVRELKRKNLKAPAPGVAARRGHTPTLYKGEHQ